MRPTLVTAVAPFRSPLKVRAERREDLANMIGKMASIRIESRDSDGTAMRLGSGSEIQKAQGEAIAFVSIRENPAFRNGPTLIGRHHVRPGACWRLDAEATIPAPRLPDDSPLSVNWRSTRPIASPLQLPCTIKKCLENPLMFCCPAPTMTEAG